MVTSILGGKRGTVLIIGGNLALCPEGGKTALVLLIPGGTRPPPTPEPPAGVVVGGPNVICGHSVMPGGGGSDVSGVDGFGQKIPVIFPNSPSCTGVSIGSPVPIPIFATVSGG